jgi:hypothetical protein
MSAELACAIRQLNARIYRLSPETQRELMDDWHASWDELQRQREAAPDKAAESEAVAKWQAHWQQRLSA